MRQGLFDHHRLDTVAMLAAGGTPVAQKILGPAPEGYCWYLEAIAFTVVGNSHTAALDVAVTPDGGDLPAQATWDHQGLVGALAAAIRGAVNPALPIYVASSHFVHAYASGGTLAAGDAVTVTFQVAVHQLDPAYLMGPEDRAQVYAAHEAAAKHNVAEVATASRRAV